MSKTKKTKFLHSLDKDNTTKNDHDFTQVRERRKDANINELDKERYIKNKDKSTHK